MMKNESTATAIRELPKEFRKFGDTFRQLEYNEEKEMYIYKRGNGCFEVFRKKVCKYPKFNRVDKNGIPHPEYYIKYPSDEDFGAWAWCCSTYEIAKRYYDNGV